jgi:hypothetical protein
LSSMDGMAPMESRVSLVVTVLLLESKDEAITV